MHHFRINHGGDFRHYKPNNSHYICEFYAMVRLNKLSVLKSITAPIGDPFSVLSISFLMYMYLQDWVMENTWEMHDKRWLFGRDISVLDDTLYHVYISHFWTPRCQYLRLEQTAHSLFFYPGRPALLTGGILEITKPCPSVPENSPLYFSKTIFKVRKSDTTTGRKSNLRSA